MKTLKSRVFGTLLVATLVLGCSTTTATNPYMDSSTIEFQQVTRSFEGIWNFQQIARDGENLMGGIFQRGTLELIPTNRNAFIIYYVSREELARRSVEWRTQWPEVRVSGYSIQVRGTWRLDPRGETLFFDAMESTLQIQGTGTTFETFLAAQRRAFEEALQERVVSNSTGIRDLFPLVNWSQGFRIIDFTEKSVQLENQSGDILRLNR